MAEPVTIVGDSIACLAAALEAARRGRAVELLADPACLGGGFGGIDAGGRRFDLGSRLFELDYEGSAPRSIDGFDPARDGHRPFIASVADFIGEIMGRCLCPAPVPAMWISQRRIPCPLLTVDLAPLASALAPAQRVKIAAEAAQGGVMPLDEAGLEQASLAQHGAGLHRALIAPILDKQGVAGADVIATQRRKLWAALYHPATVCEAFTGWPVAFRPHRPFHTTPLRAAYPFVRRLVRAVRQAGVAIVPAGRLVRLSWTRGGVVNLGFAGLERRVLAACCAIGGQPQHVFAAAGVGYAPERLQAAIQWLAVAPEDVLDQPSSLIVADPALAAFRISAAGRACFAVEFGAAAPWNGAEALWRTGVVREGAKVRLLHQLQGASAAAPSFANRRRFQSARARLGFPGTLLGGANRFGFDSLNDQIVDGMHFGRVRC